MTPSFQKRHERKQEREKMFAFSFVRDVSEHLVEIFFGAQEIGHRNEGTKEGSSSSVPRSPGNKFL